MARPAAVAVIDIGKSNAKVAVIDRATRATLSVRTTANVSRPGPPYPHYDVERLWTWLLAALKSAAAEGEIEAISVTTHGACFALMAGDELALPLLDYEHDISAIDGAYNPLRGKFSETLSPSLPGGLNAGRQIFWLQATYPREFARVNAILPYPQYWGFRLSGAKASEVTSIGCHTDLWNPGTGTWSKLAESQGWAPRFPAMAKAWDQIGTLLPTVAAETGIAPRCRVLAGIHDSNASLFPHLVSRPLPFSVLSSGTWMIVFAAGGSIAGLDEKRDCLANVDAFGRAVPSARFMAGREYDAIAGNISEPGEEMLRHVVAERIMALPCFAPGTGPYGHSAGRWTTPAADLTPGERAAAAVLYAALTSETCLKLAGARGPVIVEGPFARNRAYLSTLATRLGQPVLARSDPTGTTDGAALLAEGPNAAIPPAVVTAVAPLSVDIGEYAAAWQAAAEKRPS